MAYGSAGIAQASSPVLQFTIRLLACVIAQAASLSLSLSCLRASIKLGDIKPRLASHCAQQHHNSTGFRASFVEVLHAARGHRESGTHRLEHRLLCAILTAHALETHERHPPNNPININTDTDTSREPAARTITAPNHSITPFIACLLVALPPTALLTLIHFFDCQIRGEEIEPLRL